MKKVLVQAFCDLHDEDEEEPATTEVTHSGRLLDVCDHHHQIIGELMSRLDSFFEAGVPVEAPPPSPRRRSSGPRAGVGGRPKNDLVNSEAWRTCLEPDCATAAKLGRDYVAPTRSALSQHVKAQHGKTLSDYTWTT